jgi:membrane protein DedA with SNARE-associated domain
MSLDQIISIILEYVGRYGYWGILLLMVLENLGLPLPTEVGFVVGQSMVIAGSATYLSVFLIILLGKTFGSIISYFLGIYFAQRIEAIEDRNSGLKRAQAIFAKWMEKYGDLAVFISRLVGYVRPWSSYLAGMGEVRLLPFIVYNVLGSSVIIVLTMLTLGGAVELWRHYPILRPLALVIFFVFFFGFWLILWILRKVRIRRASQNKG